MKTLKTFVMTMTAAALLGSTGLYAQEVAVANIPFAFTVLDKTVPAGKYVIQNAVTTSKSGIVKFRNVDTGHSVAVLAPSNAASYTTKDKVAAKVIFHRYGDRYFFSEIWSADGLLNGKVQPCKLERETKSSAGNDQMAVIALPVSVGQ